jgi:hypothetical protein
VAFRYPPLLGIESEGQAWEEGGRGWTQSPLGCCVAGTPPNRVSRAGLALRYGRGIAPYAPLQSAIASNITRSTLAVEYAAPAPFSCSTRTKTP